MRKYLVVANQTLGGSGLVREIQRLTAEGPCAFHVVVPATHSGEHLVWTEGEAHAIAQRRLDATLDWFRAQGAEATGEVGDAKPMLAISDALIGQDFDAIILSTLPAGMSRWLRTDLPARARRRFGMPVTHVVSEPERVRHPA